MNANNTRTIPNSTNATNQTSNSTITNVQEETILAALRSLHSIVATRGEVLPAFDQCDAKALEYVLTRTNTALVEKARARSAELYQGVADKVAAIVQAARDEGNVLVAEFHAMSQALRSRLGVTEAPSTVTIPYMDLAACFPDGVQLKDIVKHLGTLGIHCSAPKGPSPKGKEAHEVLRAVLPIVPPVATVAA